jgi:hypothetical protein
VFLEAFPQDLPLSLPFGSEMGKIHPCNLSPHSIRKKKKKYMCWNLKNAQIALNYYYLQKIPLNHLEKCWLNKFQVAGTALQ